MSRKSVVDGATGDSSEIIADARARYFGLKLNDASLTPGRDALIGKTSFAEWLLARSARQRREPADCA